MRKFAVSLPTRFKSCPRSLPLLTSVAFVLVFQTTAAAMQLHGTSADASWKLAQTDPAALVQRVSQVELTHSIGNRTPMRFRLRKITEKSDTTKEIVETSDGAVARLLAIRGVPLTPEQNKLEENRLEAVASDPAIESHRRKSEQRDTNRVEEIMRLLPEAYQYRYAGSASTVSGEAIRLAFFPNPKFSPPDLMSRVLKGIQGELWIEPGGFRVVRMQGRSFRNVDYGWGLLGTLDKGGTVLLEQTKTRDCGWQLAHLVLQLRGKALLLKPVRISVDETASEYHPVPRSWTYQDAAHWLLDHPAGAARQ